MGLKVSSGKCVCVCVPCDDSQIRAGLCPYVTPLAIRVKIKAKTHISVQTA